MRTNYCGKVSEQHIGQQVTLCGWVQRRRDLGGMIFIDLRDREGVVQVYVDPERRDLMDLASQLKNEYCIKCCWYSACAS